VETRTRPSLDRYYLTIALAISSRSTCLDKQVGCVLTDATGIILATGYNGAPHGHVHCTDLGFCIKDASGNPATCPSAHAEQNALLHCSDIGKVHTAYLTLSPCIACVRMLLNTNCSRIIYTKAHRHDEPAKLWKECRPNGEWQQIDPRTAILFGS
jgi:dCMP deaminase